MSVGGFTLADRLGAKTVPCRVRGCSRTLLQFANKALTLASNAPDDPNDPAAGMCEPCRKRLKELKEAQRPCERPGCSGTWTWAVAGQLEAFATRRPTPKGLCAECESKLSTLEAKEITCGVPGCSRTTTVTPKAQLLSEGVVANQHPGEAGGITITGALCAPCAEVGRKLKDRQINCGITGCDRKWVWRADDQIQFFAAGKPNEPPRRMCEECRAEFGKLLDRDVRCRTSGCKNTWIWPRNDQLDACLAGKPAPKAPARMCERCFDVFSGLKDVDRPCRRAGCKGTWLDKRGAQLARVVRGKVGDPYPHYCTNCEKELGDLQDREISCKTEGCPGTWTWSKEQQLAAGVRPKIPDDLPAKDAATVPTAQTPDETTDAAEAPGNEPPLTVIMVARTPLPAPKESRNKKKKRGRREPQPPEKRCSACAEFLAARKTLEIPCSQCATPIYWPPESQLQTHLGNWAVPGLCGACKRDATEAARKVAREALRAQVIAGSVHHETNGTPPDLVSSAPETPPEPAS